MPKPASSSLRALRHALRRSDRPVTLHWIGIGALTNFGVLLTLLAAAVWIGNRAGVDFSIVDREGASHHSFVPLAWLLIATMLSFPVSGFLIAKASAAKTVFEPALATMLAITILLLTFGLAAPEVLAQALVAAPIAFVLAGIGAWFGLTPS